jgi:RNA polymerase sigma-70 factor (ECF subfamily)
MALAVMPIAVPPRRLVESAPMQREELTVAPVRSAEPIADADLMAALVRGERDALAALYDRHAGLLLALAVRILEDRSHAEELLHDVFLEAWHHARDFDPSRGTVRAWLVTRTRSRALDQRGARARQARLAEQAARESGEVAGSEAAPPLDAARLRGQIVRLPSELVAVLELAYFEGLSSTEIAQALDVPVGTVKSRVARALAVLREQMGLPPGGAP